jgi:cation:H+ antiporter
LMVGAEVLVQGAIAGGQALGVREAVIGMTVVALGTSLPELGACVAAARKRQTDIIVGGLVGSAIFNILSIVAITAMLKPLAVAPEFAGLDLIAVIAVTGLVAAGLLLLRSFTRWMGAVLVAGYVVFIANQFLG